MQSNPDATINDTSRDFISCRHLVATTSACNFDPEVNFGDDSCVFANLPYDCDGNCVNDADGDEVCDELEIPGCQDPMACNFDSTATDPPLDEYPCTYAAPLYECDGSCIDDQDGDGVCDDLEVEGCQEPLACNFHALATDSAECLFADAPCESCTGNVDYDGTGTVI